MTDSVDALRLMPQKLTDVIAFATQHNAMSELIGLTTQEQIDVMAEELAGESTYLQRVYALRQEDPEKQRAGLFEDYCHKIQADVAKELLENPREGVQKLYASYTAPYTQDDVEHAVSALELIKSTSNMGNLRVMVNNRTEEGGDTHSITHLPKITALCEDVTCYLAPAHIAAALKPADASAAMRG
jgi:hypothetical protein